jgi:hypothetical protein
LEGDDTLAAEFCLQQRGHEITKTGTINNQAADTPAFANGEGFGILL